MQVGLFLSNLPPVRHKIDNPIIQAMEFVVDFGMICHMFVVGLEIDPYIFLQIPLREAKVACSGVLTTFVLASLLTPFMRVPENPNYIFNFCLATILSGTASPLLTRLITDLKIGKSDIGRFVVSAGVHSDLISTLIISLGFVFFDPYNSFSSRNSMVILTMGSTLFIQTVLAAKLTPIVMNWVNHENPEGKPMKGSHLVLSIAYIVLVCSFSPNLGGYNKILSAFIAGVFMPRDGRIARMIITKVNYLTITIFNPLFFFWVGLQADFSKSRAGHIDTWGKLLFLFLIATIGKVLGSLVTGVILGFHWPESVAIGLLLNVKGRFQVYLALMASKVSLYTRDFRKAILFIPIFLCTTSFIA